MSTKAVSIVKMTRQRKAKMLVGSTALKLAKSANDPLYKRYQLYRLKMLELRKRIMRKYGPKALAQVRKSVGIARKTW